MTDCSVYGGNLDDPKFKWEGGDWSGNVPGGISPYFPSPKDHYNANYHAWVKASGVECKQTDFGGWVVKVTREQILEYLTWCYAGQEDLPWVKEDLQKVVRSIRRLRQGKIYGLVATEF